MKIASTEMTTRHDAIKNYLLTVQGNYKYFVHKTGEGIYFIIAFRIYKNGQIFKGIDQFSRVNRQETNDLFGKIC